MARKQKSTTTKANAKVNARAVWRKADPERWLEIFTAAGLQHARSSGAGIKARCHAHDDKGPSLSIKPEDGYAHCFGCGRAWRDPIALVASIKKEAVDDAARWLAETWSIRILDENTIKEITAAHERRLNRDRAVNLGCELLAKAIGLWRGDKTEQAIYDAGLGSTLLAIEWMAERRFGVAPNVDITPDNVRHIWQALAREGLIGAYVPVAFAGDDRDLVKGFSLAFGDAPFTDLGKPIMPWRRIDGTAGQIKIRTLNDDPKAPKYTVLSHAEDGDDGVYMSRSLPKLLRDVRGSHVPIMAMEGETGVLALESRQDETEIGMAVVVALGGGQTASVDPLVMLGVDELRIVGDVGSSGAMFVRRVAARTYEPVTMRVLTWDTEQVVKGDVSPDDMITRRGSDTWRSMTREHMWTALHTWLATRAEATVHENASPDKRGSVALDWGRCLRGEQDRAAYVADVAKRLDLDPTPLRRDLDRLAEGRYIPRDLGAPMNLVSETIRRFRGDDVDPVFDEGSVWRCEGGLWRPVEEHAIVNEVMSLEGLEWGVGDGDERREGMVRLNPSDPRTLAKLVPSKIARKGFFGDEVAGVATADGQFLRAVAGRVVAEPLKPQHRQRWAAPVAWSRGARCPRWERYLFEVLRETHCTCRTSSDTTCVETSAPGHAAQHVCWPRDMVAPPTIEWFEEWKRTQLVMTALMEFVGLALFNEATRFKKAVILDGPGDNGKSVANKVLHALAEGATSALAPHEFGARFSRVALVGKRLNLVDEMANDDLVASDSYKAIIAGGVIKAEHKHRDPFEFAPRAGHIFAANELPATRDNSDGFWTRAMVVRMPHRFTQRTRDAGLADYIIANELPGILAWALHAGAKALHHGRYTEAPQIEAARDEWRQNADLILAWLRDATEPTNGPGDKSGDLYDAFSRWLERRGHKPMTHRTFVLGLARHNVPKHPGRTDGRRYQIKSRLSRDDHGEKPAPRVRGDEEVLFDAQGMPSTH
jgi:P4 family phage/plasmid primase-like protien